MFLPPRQVEKSFDSIPNQDILVYRKRRARLFLEKNELLSVLKVLSYGFVLGEK